MKKSKIKSRDSHLKHTLSNVYFGADAEACGIGWKRYGASCYKIKTARKTWVQAVSDCESEGASLVKVCNKGELEFIYYAFVRPLDTGSAWIGLSLTNGSFHWLDGSWPQYKNWNWGEPNNYNGDEHCVEVYVKNGKWNDVPCLLYRPFVCEKGMLPLQKQLRTDKIHPHTFIALSYEDVTSDITKYKGLSYGHDSCMFSISSFQTPQKE